LDEAAIAGDGIATAAAIRHMAVVTAHTILVRICPPSLAVAEDDDESLAALKGPPDNVGESVFRRFAP